MYDESRRKKEEEYNNQKNVVYEDNTYNQNQNQNQNQGGQEGQAQDPQWQEYWKNEANPNGQKNNQNNQYNNQYSNQYNQNQYQNNKFNQNSAQQTYYDGGHNFMDSVKSVARIVCIVIAVLVVAVAAMNSWYTLSEEEYAVVTTFGAPSVQETSGLHFKIPFVQKVTKVSKAIMGMEIGYTTDPNKAAGASENNPVSIDNESLMITNDFNLVNVDFYVEYMVTDPIQAVRYKSVYEDIIKSLAQSYIRDTVGLYDVDDVITTGKTEIQENIKEKLTNRLVEEDIGYGIYNVSIQDTEMPREDVAEAFRSVEDAKQGMETAINEALKYQSENIPLANAEADRLLQEAEAYKQERINEATGQAARFESTYAEYVNYPLITKRRMFYETIEDVLPGLKVIIDDGSGTQTVLPLDSFVSSDSSSGSSTSSGRTTTSGSTTSSTGTAGSTSSSGSSESTVTQTDSGGGSDAVTADAASVTGGEQ